MKGVIAPFRLAFLLSPCVPFPSVEVERINGLTQVLLDEDETYVGVMLQENDTKWKEARYQLQQAKTFIDTQLQLQVQRQTLLPLVLLNWPLHLIDLMHDYL
jgi:hypothetical protein